MNIQMAFLNVQRQCRSQQIFDFTLMCLKQFLLGFDIGIVARDNGRLEKSGRRQLFGIACDNDSPGPSQHGECFFQAAL